MSRFRRFKENNDMFINKWHLASEVEPCGDDEVWFVDNCGELHVGMYNEDVHAFAECDGMGVKVEDVVQWKVVNEPKEMMKFPGDGATVAVELAELNCLALGMYTDRYIDAHGDRNKAVVLHPSYHFEDEVEGEIAVRWSAVTSWYNAPEVEMLRAREDAVEVVTVSEPEGCEDCVDDNVITEVEPTDEPTVVEPCEDCCPECEQDPCVCEEQPASELAKLAAEEPEKDLLESKIRESDEEDQLEADMIVKVEDDLDSKVEELKSQGYEVVGIEDAEDGSKMVKAKKMKESKLCTVIYRNSGAQATNVDNAYQNFKYQFEDRHENPKDWKVMFGLKNTMSAEQFMKAYEEGRFQEAKYNGPSFGRMLKAHQDEIAAAAYAKDNNKLIAIVEEAIQPAITDVDQKQYAFEMLQKMRKQSPMRNLDYVWNLILAATDKVIPDRSRRYESKMKESVGNMPEGLEVVNKGIDHDYLLYKGQKIGEVGCFDDDDRGWAYSVELEVLPPKEVFDWFKSHTTGAWYSHRWTIDNRHLSVIEFHDTSVIKDGKIIYSYNPKSYNRDANVDIYSTDMERIEESEEYDGKSYMAWLEDKFLEDFDNMIGEKYADCSSEELEQCLVHVINEYGFEI